MIKDREGRIVAYDTRTLGQFLCWQENFQNVFLHPYQFVAISGQIKFTRQHFRVALKN
jgi:hypothetical protein